MLLKSKFPMNEQTNKGMTAAAIAAQKGHLPILTMLKDAGVDINLTNNYGVGPLYLSILNDHKDCAIYLIENGAQMYYKEIQKRDLSPIFLVIRKQNTEILEVLCDHGCSLTCRDSKAMTPLMFASAYMTSLLQKNDNDQQTNQEITKGFNDIVNYLTLRTKDLNQEDFNSLTILMHYLF